MVKFRFYSSEPVIIGSQYELMDSIKTQAEAINYCISSAISTSSYTITLHAKLILRTTI